MGDGMNKLDQEREEAAKVIDRFVKENGTGKIMTNREVMKLINSNGVETGVMFQPSDICYNRTNAANLDTFAGDIHLFEYIGRNSYRLIGRDYPYTGLIYRKPQEKSHSEIIVGEWFQGHLCRWEEEKCQERIAYEEKNQKEIEDIDTVLDDPILQGIEREALVNVRVNQGIFRERLLRRYNHCCLCKVSNPQFLIASHIKPWSVSETEEKLDADNGLLMCPNHDRLFDKGWITFDDDGKIIISKLICSSDRVFLNVQENMRIELCEGNRKYMAYHRKHIFIDTHT
jgi:hypothetical protein